jgi:hypothetical protein
MLSEQEIQAVKLRLGINPADVESAKKAWEVLRGERSSPDLLCKYLTDLMNQVFKYKLGLARSLGPMAQVMHDELWVNLANWLGSPDGGKSLSRFAGILREALPGRRPPAASPKPIARPVSRPPVPTGYRPTPPPLPPPAPRPPVATPRTPDAVNAPVGKGSGPDASDSFFANYPGKEAPVQGSAPPAAPPPESTGPPPEAIPVEDPSPLTQPENALSSSFSQWKNIPVPEGPDNHTEYDSRAGRSPEGLPILGARVRGKKHKHEGTNCDDWFEFAVSGRWTLLAVADGAGSKKFSRVGAEVSCKAAVRHLAETLKDCAASGTITDPDLSYVQEALHEAMRRGYAAVVSAANERAGSEAHRRILGRPLNVQDLSATLLLAAHMTGQYQDRPGSLVMACQVGDGMTAAVDATKFGLQLLGEADSGEYSGETEFLTSARKLEPEYLGRKTKCFFGPLRALMVMSDGVADDYFPNDPELLRLHADLVLNQILEVQGLKEESIAEALNPTNLKDASVVARTPFHEEVKSATAGEAVLLQIASAKQYADELYLEPGAVYTSPALLKAGSRARPMCLETMPEERLRVWLDSYYVRGSFDDRTLLILYRETVT